MSGLDELDAMIAKCRAMPELGKRAAPDVADAMRKAIVETINAGTDTEGKTWEPRKADGGRPLENAAAAVKAAAIGTRILVRVTGPEARHHMGRARGGTMRGIIPTRLTPRLADAVRKVLTDHFRAMFEEG